MAKLSTSRVRSTQSTRLVHVLKTIMDDGQALLEFISMGKFFIEMGQGVIITGDLRVRTSPTYTCSLIAGTNPTTNKTGAYHYPADSLGTSAIVNEMQEWLDELQPASLLVIHPTSDDMNGSVNPKLRESEDKLDEWLQAKFPRAQFRSTRGGGLIESISNVLEGGHIMRMTQPFGRTEEFVPLQNRDAGKYTDNGGFTLIGKNRS